MPNKISTFMESLDYYLTETGGHCTGYHSTKTNLLVTSSSGCDAPSSWDEEIFVGPIDTTDFSLVKKYKCLLDWEEGKPALPISWEK